MRYKRFSLLYQDMVSKNYFSVKLIPWWKLRGVCSRHCILWKLPEQFIFRCKSLFVSPMTGNCTWLGLLALLFFFFFFPFVFLAMPSFSGALLKKGYGRFGAIGFLETVILTSAPSLCQVHFHGLVSDQSWWHVDTAGHMWQWDARGQRGTRLFPPNFQNPALYRRRKSYSKNIMDNVSIKEKSRRWGVTTVLRRAETEKSQGESTEKTDLSGSQLSS